MCQEIFIKPKILSCGHTVCLICLIKILEKSMENILYEIPRCPICNFKIFDVCTNYSLEKLVNNMLFIFKASDKYDTVYILTLENHLQCLINKHTCLKLQINTVNLYKKT